MYISDLNVNTFIKAMDEYSRKMSTGVTLCILSPVALIGMAGLVTEDGRGVLSESAFVVIGLLILLILVAIGVMLIIRSSIEINKFKNIREGEFYLEENKNLAVEQTSDEFETVYGKRMALGVGLCIISPIPIITTAIVGAGDEVILLMVSLLLIIVATAVNMFVKNSIKRNGYMQLLKREDFDPNNRKAAMIEERVGGIYWPVVVAIFLGWSFLEGAWTISWVVFPIAGLIYAAIVNFIKRS